MKKTLLKIITLLSFVGVLASSLKETEGAVYLFLGVMLISSLLNGKGLISRIIQRNIFLLKNFCALDSFLKKKGNPQPNSAKELTAKMLGSRIKKQRKRMKLTQGDLAKKSGIARPNICRIERGKHNPSTPTLERIAKVLKVPVGKFL